MLMTQLLPYPYSSVSLLK